MSDYNYYRDQLERTKMIHPKEGPESEPTIKILTNNSKGRDTHWLNLNHESAKELVKWLTETYLTTPGPLSTE